MRIVGDKKELTRKTVGPLHTLIIAVINRQNDLEKIDLFHQSVD